MDPPPAVPPFSAAAREKLRLMCSYNGHIVPRPHDKALCYVGGDTRIFACDRRLTHSSLVNRLSKTLMNGKPFTLKYQLPNEDLDSLISLSTDEDLENMIEEYDQIATGKKSGRIRIFLFPVKPDSDSSIESFLDTSFKSEDWFLNILNGSESGSVNCSTCHEDDILAVKSLSIKEDEKIERVIETMSSFGSASSSPSVGNLIRVQVEENKVGTDEKFDHMSVKKHNDKNVLGISGEYLERVFMDEPTMKIETQSQWNNVSGVDVDLISPDSVSSDSGTTNQIMMAMMHSDVGLVHNQTESNRVAVYPADPFQIQEVQDPTHVDQKNHQYNLSQQHNLQQQQQFIQYNMSHQQQQNQNQHFGQYVSQHRNGVVPMASYFPIYHPQQQPINTQNLIDENYPLFYGHTQAYNLPIQQSNYNDTVKSQPSKVDMVNNNVYRTATLPNPSQHQPQYVGIPHIRHPSQSIPPPNYVYKMPDPSHTQVYYTQPMAPQLAAHYDQNMAFGPMMVFPESLAQLPIDNVKHQSR